MRNFTCESRKEFLQNTSEYYHEAYKTLVFVAPPRASSRLQCAGPFGVDLLAGLFLFLERRTE